MSMKQNPSWEHNAQAPVPLPHLELPPSHELLQLLPAAIYTCDTEGHILFHNKAAQALWGRHPVAGVDKWSGAYKMLHVNKTPMSFELSPMAESILGGRPVTGKEMIIVRPDETTRHVLAQVQPLFDEAGKATGAICLLEDLTDLKGTENKLRLREGQMQDLSVQHTISNDESIATLIDRNEALKKSEERYHKMIEEVEDYAIIMLDKEGIIQNWNRGAQKIKGYAEEEIVGRSFSSFYLPDDRDTGLPQKLLQQARNTGKAIHEGWRMRRDGSRFWGSIVLTAMHNDQGEVIGFSKVTRDLTERKLAEDRLREYTNQLEFQNGELEQFAYAASHDMKEPLRKIHLYNTYIAENETNHLDEKSREFLKRSIEAVRRMANLIDDLLAYSKTAVHAENFEQVNLNIILDEILLIHKEELEQHQVHVNADPLPVVKAIPFQMKQLLFNLINNSIKYRYPGRDVQIQVSAEKVLGADFEEDAEASHTYHRISIIDNGIGFESHYAEKIFNIFQRLSNAKTSGSGIGLAICKRIVQNHHGFIKASGKLNAGARFDIYLPS